MKEKIVSHDHVLDPNQIISRYLDLPKFVDLLRTNELYLESAVSFDDRLEGTLPEAVRKSYLEILKEERRRKTIEELEYENKLRTNISCWTLGQEDNMALWKIYGGSFQSVTISTTINKIISSSFNWCNEGTVTIKKVRYINHAGKLPDGVYTLNEHTFGLKHEAYSFEREVRVVLTRPLGSSKKALRLPLNVNTAITKIIVSPESGSWFYDLVTDIARMRIPAENDHHSGLKKTTVPEGKRPPFRNENDHRSGAIRPVDEVVVAG